MPDEERLEKILAELSGKAGGDDRRKVDKVDIEIEKEGVPGLSDTPHQTRKEAQLEELKQTIKKVNETKNRKLK